MSTPPDPGKFVRADRPVNRRTAPRAAPPPVAPAARQRLLRNRAQGRLGAPLARQLLAVESGQSGAPSALAIVGSTFGAAGGVLLLLALLQQSVELAALGGPAALAGGLLAWKARRPAADGGEPAAAQPLFTPALAEQLDALLDQIAPDLEESSLAELREIKQLLVRLGRHGAPCDEHFQPEDRHYVVECVRRYLPDTLEAWLRVPAEHRATQALNDGRTASDLLLDQLVLLHSELANREAKAARSSAEGLLRQQRFLDAKRRG